MSMLSQGFSVMIYCGIIAPGQRREVIYGLNATDKRFLFKLISTVELTGAKGYDTHMVIHTISHTSDVSLAREFQKHLSNAERKHGVIYQDKLKKVERKGVSCS